MQRTALDAAFIGQSSETRCQKRGSECDGSRPIRSLINNPGRTSQSGAVEVEARVAISRTTIAIGKLQDGCSKYDQVLKKT
jgi:hypothetical protein